MIKRRTEYFVLTVMLPCLVIGTIEMITFFLPYDQTVRLDLSFTCLLAYLMFQMMIMSQLPNSAENPPLLLLLISLFTVYIGVAIIFQGICIYLVNITKCHPDSTPSRVLQEMAIRLAKVIAPDYLKRINNERRREMDTSIDNEILFNISDADKSFGALGFEKIL